MNVPYQLFDALPEPIEAALRASIERFGVLTPVVTDQHGNMLDGHHRKRIADELKVKYRVDVVAVADPEEARELARTLNADRRQLTEQQRREVTARLRQDGHSYRAIAGALGTSEATARRDVQAAEIASRDAISPERVSRRGGGSYPARRPLVVTARHPREADRARAALATAAALVPESGLLDVKRAERLARQADLERRRAQPVELITVAGGIDIRHGDLSTVLADIPDGTVDAIVTDPPYGAEYLPLYGDLGKLAARLLKPDGVLAVLHGHNHLIAQHNGIATHVPFVWPCVYLLTGPSATISFLRLDVAQKPLWLYAKPGARLPALGNDVFRSRGADKSHHDWGQSVSGMADVVERLTQPGALVVDPFLGGGTTAVACRQLGRRFVGCDADPAAVATARQRLADGGGAA